MVLLPVVYLLGLVTLGRLRQVSAEWRIYGQGMNRIRHYFLEVTPDLLTAGMVVAVINSVLAGVFAWLLGSLAASGPVIPALCATAGFLISLTILGVQQSGCSIATLKPAGCLPSRSRKGVTELKTPG